VLIEFNEENWPIPQKISLVGEELVFLVFLWNGRLFLLKALGGAAQKQQCPLRVVEKLGNLTTLNLSYNSGLQSLAGLEKLGNLTTLNLSGNNGLQSLAWLEKLGNLTTLDLSGNNGLQSLAGLEKLTRLENLDLSGCPIKSLKPLGGLKRLKTLNLRGTKIPSFEGLPTSVTSKHSSKGPIGYFVLQLP
jgi:Leucine-rich repeat (LRR) protein